MNYQELLPIGSVVLLKGAQTKLMITGRIVTDEKMEEIYDYVGVIYPIGASGDSEQYFFNRDAIELPFSSGIRMRRSWSFATRFLPSLMSWR